MKKSIIRTIIGMVTITSLMLACAEADSATNQLLWSGSCLLVCGISAKVFDCITKGEQEEEI